MSETGKIPLENLAPSRNLTLSACREENRQQEMLELIAKGKIPHQVEMDKHPEKSLEGHRCESESSLE